MCEDFVGGLEEFGLVALAPSIPKSTSFLSGLKPILLEKVKFLSFKFFYKKSSFFLDFLKCVH
jgi:hypothetical protein